ncbi:MAG: hypothetical protein FVQ80_13395 [Planctomycetes bacterium]|nr:hypothetical protein [Planctomycetota bacterium]
MRIEEEIISSIKTEIVDFSSDYIETLIDSGVSDGIVKDIPIIGTVLSIYRTSKSVRDYIFAKNIMLFLSSIDNISAEKRKAMINKLETNERLGMKCGSFLISVLSKLDTSEKAKLSGFIFKKYINGEIDGYNNLKLISLVEKMFWPDIKEFALADDIKQVSRYIIDNLISLGLMTIQEVGTVVGYKGGPIGAVLNDFGKVAKSTLREYFNNDHCT